MASRVRTFLTLTARCSWRNLQPSQGIVARFASNKSYFDDPGAPRVALCKDGETIAMYHPQQEISYEDTTPIPRDDKRYTFESVDALVRERLEMSDIAQRPVEPPSVEHMFPMHDRDNLPTVMELAGMFYTTKHRWFPKKGTDWRNKNPPQDRPNT